MSLPKVLIISGPTAIGKSAAALSLKAHHHIEIISADSVQVYRGLDIGSNKPSARERALVPHHMIDIANPWEGERTAGDFFRRARSVIQEVIERKNVPIVVGGTMMYVRWLVHGKPATPKAGRDVKENVERMIEGKTWEEAVEMLREKDEERAEGLNRNDWYRLKRGLEIVQVAGKGVSELPVVGAAPGSSGEWEGVDVRWVFLWGDREKLYRRIDRRCEDMIWDGLIEEVGRGVEWGGVVWKAIGYRQAVKCIVEMGLTGGGVEVFRAFLEEFMAGSRGYAKQQMAWYRKEGGVGWIEGGEGVEDRILQALEMNRDEWDEVLKGERQKEVREEIVKMGKGMKGYVARKEMFAEGSEAEQQMVERIRKVSEEVIQRLGREELERIGKLVAG